VADGAAPAEMTAGLPPGSDTAPLAIELHHHDDEVRSEEGGADGEMGTELAGLLAACLTLPSSNLHPRSPRQPWSRGGAASPRSPRQQGRRGACRAASPVLHPPPRWQGRRGGWCSGSARLPRASRRPPHALLAGHGGEEGRAGEQRLRRPWSRSSAGRPPRPEQRNRRRELGAHAGGGPGGIGVDG
jgi:hypothetical protein